ncbi:MAG: hypothetical protein GEU87_06780 [Alphaproteobacteria bacterium]|nr:hypothetical protein [Alphaproteobacteria bacterium]
MRRFVAVLAVAFCLSAATSAEAQPEQPIALSQILGAPLWAAGGRQPAIGSVEDLIVADDGRVQVIVQVIGQAIGQAIVQAIVPDGGSGAAGRIVPWNDLAYDAVRNEFTLRAGGSLAGFQVWVEPGTEAPGTAGKLLASKLLEGLVKSPQGEDRGEVKDVHIGRDGTIRQVFFIRDQRMASIPWAGVVVLPEQSEISAAPGTEAIIVVDRKKL